MRVKSGNAEVDAILGGGFPSRAIHVIMGAPGTGKTILAEQLAFANASSDCRVLYVATFSEPLQKLIGFLQNFSFAKMEQLGTELLYEYIGEEMLTAPERLPQRVQELITLHRPKIIVIDSFKALADLMADCSAWRRTLDAVGGMLSAYDATTFLVGEYTSEMLTQLQRALGSFGAEPGKLVGPGKFDHFYVSPVEMQIDCVAGEIMRRIERDGVKRVVIDAVSDLEKGAANPIRYRDLLYSLTQMFAARNVTSMLLVETAGLFPGQGISGYEVSYMSDNIVVLEMVLGEDLTRTIRIVKSRGSQHDGNRHPLRITASAMEVG